MFLGTTLAWLAGLGLAPTACQSRGTEEAEPATPISAPQAPVRAEPAEAAEQEPVTEPVAPARPTVVEGQTEPARPVAPSRPVQSPTQEAGDRPVTFADFAFPPTLSDTAHHGKSWLRDDCLRCHETGVQDATVVRHADMPDVLLTAKCRSCHVLIPGSEPAKPKPKPPEEQRFADFAFPPMIPASNDHRGAWNRTDCLLCHEDGTQGAPLVVHQDMPKRLMKAKCRTCHVQVRAVEASGPAPGRYSNEGR